MAVETITLKGMYFQLVETNFFQPRVNHLLSSHYDEEYEDADGNVYNKKTYEDLRRQGLI